VERRRLVIEESRANRTRDTEASGAEEDDGALERILEDLRNGDAIRTRRRRGAGTRPSEPLEPISTDIFNAKDMLAQLQSHGFVAPPSPSVASQQQQQQQRRRRRRTERGLGVDGDKEPPMSPLASEILDLHDDSASEAADRTEDEMTESRTS